MDRHSRILGRSSCLSAGGRMAGSLIRFTLAGAAATLAACQSSSPFDDPMFERKDLDRLVSDAYDTPWRGDGMIVPETPPIPVPDRPMASGGAPLRGFERSRTLDADEPVAPLPPRERTLAELAVRALEMNPTTRAAWESARAAAGRQGMAESLYLPRAGVYGKVDWERSAYPALPAPLIYEGGNADTGFSLSWLLLDFGRREAARRGVEAANLSANRQIQKVIYDVQTAYFQLDAKVMMVEAAEEDLANARMQLEAVEDRMRVGLATRPELLEARQQFAKAQFMVEDTKADLYDAQSALAIAVGVPAGTRIDIVPLQRMPLPEDLLIGVDAVVARTLRQRPDLQAAIATVRQARAAIKQAEADFLPTISFYGDIGAGWLDGESRDGNEIGMNDGIALVAEAGVRGTWLLYEGGERTAKLHEARANLARAEAQLDELQLVVSNEVWMAYFDVRAARKRFIAGEALLAASQDSYDSVFASYVNGLATITQLIQSEAGLFDARYTLIQSRADLLMSAARLAFASGSDVPMADRADFESR
jgi:outer membrane protein TolC